MESKDLSEKIEWETRRVAAAFGVKKWKRFDDWRVLRSYHDNYFVDFHLSLEGGINSLYVKSLDESDWCVVWFDIVWDVCPADYEATYDTIMARGLYCLGIDNKMESGQLHAYSTLSHQEKLELRLSMPREFWPQKWLDEEAT